MVERQFPTIEEVALGGLLHDVGKLVQRAKTGSLPQSLLDRQADVLPSEDGQATHWHALWSDWFFGQAEAGELKWPRGIDRSRVRNLAVYHHRPLQYYSVRPELAVSALVALADKMASGFERKTRDADAEAGWAESGDTRNRFCRTPIESFSSHLSLDGSRTAGKLYHFPHVLSPDAVLSTSMPSGDLVESGYKELWSAFCDGWNDAVERCGSDGAAFEEAVLSLSERFLWAIPSSTTDQPDISLHDHARAVAAFASAAFRWHEAAGTLGNQTKLVDRDVPAFQFLVGDLSGLQATLFRLNGENSKGVNKTLRGRSMRFQLIADSALRQVLNAFGMPMSAALQTAGGRFLLVVPALEDASHRVGDLRARFDRWFASQYSGELALGLSLSEPFSAADLIAPPEAGPEEPVIRANKVRASLAVAVEAAKLGLLAEQAEGGILENDFANGPCETCAVRPATRDGRCDACAAELNLGTHLPLSRATLVMRAGSVGADAMDVLGQGYRLALGEGDDRQDKGRGWRWILHPSEHGPAPLRCGPAWVARFGENIEPYANLEDAQPGQIKTFEALASDSKDGERGRPMLALLKGDIDRLGQIFTSGLGDRWSVTRAATLSRMIDAYFSLRLPWLLETEFPDSYTVYAGGDDFMLVLPWRQGFELARKLREDFSNFTGGNSDLTFSLGIALFGPRTPIAIAAREAEARLDAAKTAGRNRVCAIETEAMTWDAFSNALDHAEQLDDWLNTQRVSTSLLYRLLSLDDARSRIHEGRARPSDFSWMARLGYQLARNLKDPEVRDGLREMFGLDQDWAGTRDIRAGVRLAISHAMYRNR